MASESECNDLSSHQRDAAPRRRWVSFVSRINAQMIGLPVATAAASAGLSLNLRSCLSQTSTGCSELEGRRGSVSH